MFIKEINIGDFGKLSCINMSLKKGVNVISGKNEAGKSTLASFISYILYGFAKSADKQKYMSDLSPKVHGAITVETDDGKTFLAERKGATKSSGRLSDNTGENVFSGAEIGKYLLNLDSVAFRKSAFMGQNDITEGKLDGLSDVIRNLLLGGDGEADAETVKKKLNSAKNLIYNTSRKSGSLFLLERELDEINRKIAESSDKNNELTSKREALEEGKKKLSETESRRSSLKQMQTALQAKRARSKLEEIATLEKELLKAEVILSASKEALEFDDGFVVDSAYIAEVEKMYYDAQATQRLYDFNLKNIEKTKSELEEAKKNSTLLGVITAEEAKAITLQIDGISGKIAHFKRLSKLFLLLIVTFPLFFVYRAKAKRLTNELCKLCGKYGCDTVEELKAKLAELASVEHTCERLNSLLLTMHNELERTKSMLDEQTLALNSEMAKCKELAELSFQVFKKELNARLNTFAEAHSNYRVIANGLDSLLGNTNREELEAQASMKIDVDTPINETQLKQEYEKLSLEAENTKNEIFLLEKRVAVLESSFDSDTELNDIKNNIKQKIDDECMKKDAYLLAMSILDDACADVRQNAVPKMSARATDLFYKLSGERYDLITVSDEDMMITVRDKESRTTFGEGMLSVGTLDAAYISLRLAFADCFCIEKPPVIFDDSFSSFDNDRLENMIKLLYELSDEYQIIILTCHDRELEIIKKLGNECNAVKI